MVSLHAHHLLLHYNVFSYYKITPSMTDENRDDPIKRRKELSAKLDGAKQELNATVQRLSGLPGLDVTCEVYWFTNFEYNVTITSRGRTDHLDPAVREFIKYAGIPTSLSFDPIFSDNSEKSFAENLFRDYGKTLVPSHSIDERLVDDAQIREYRRQCDEHHKKFGTPM